MPLVSIAIDNQWYTSSLLVVQCDYQDSRRAITYLASGTLMMSLGHLNPKFNINVNNINSGYRKEYFILLLIIKALNNTIERVLNG